MSAVRRLQQWLRAGGECYLVDVAGGRRALVRRDSAGEWACVAVFDCLSIERAERDGRVHVDAAHVVLDRVHRLPGERRAQMRSEVAAQRVRLTRPGAPT